MTDAVSDGVEARILELCERAVKEFGWTFSTVEPKNRSLCHETGCALQACGRLFEEPWELIGPRVGVEDVAVFGVAFDREWRGDAHRPSTRTNSRLDVDDPEYKLGVRIAQSLKKLQGE